MLWLKRDVRSFRSGNTQSGNWWRTTKDQKEKKIRITEMNSIRYARATISIWDAIEWRVCVCVVLCAFGLSSKDALWHGFIYRTPAARPASWYSEPSSSHCYTSWHLCVRSRVFTIRTHACCFCWHTRTHKQIAKNRHIHKSYH